MGVQRHGRERKSERERTGENGATPLSTELQFHHSVGLMGCRCCRMIKSYIYDPTAPVEVHARRHESSSSSLYQRKPLETDNIRKVQGFHNLGYSHKYGDGLKNGAARLEIDNNQINRLHAPPGDGARDRATKPEPVDKLEGRLIDGTPPRENGDPFARAQGEDDAESVLSGRSEDVNTSTTTLSSADTKDRFGRGDAAAPGVSAGESSCSEEEEEEEEEGDSGSITDSEVAEALAALEAATAGEDYD
ncbi:hypothetical protein SKAU_G00030440 [Synaphobranchus kaupii]|uniref:Uncharacterized protein n=1 Tax=Synaphobranchus kaupii TaxID=118154 RepID=A0A9Q1GEU9_SYNKA|nr:hypothetical protein SKAU_G00030440 [Synaphobranchus kaupii]